MTCCKVNIKLFVYYLFSQISAENGKAVSGNCTTFLHLCFLYSSGQGGYAYLKEWLWWAGLISSKKMIKRL